jgi:hypothetical protein
MRFAFALVLSITLHASADAAAVRDGTSAFCRSWLDRRTDAGVVGWTDVTTAAFA